MTQFPLEDLKVLDLSRVLAGPFAGRMLSDLGAEVVKVEPPDQDVTRNWGRVYGGISGYFHQQNAGKHNISINFKHADGVQLLRDMVKKADILIENFRPGVMEKLGIGWDVLKTDNPGLIMLSISGFGQTGPESRRAAYAPIIHAETGSVKRQAERSGGRHVEMCMSFADTNAGLHGLVGLLAALHQKQRTGQGQHIDIAMVDAMLVTDDQTYGYLEKSRPATIASEVWEAVDGLIILAGDFRHLWRAVVDIHGVQDPTPAEAELEEKIQFRRKAFEEFLLSFPDRAALIEALDQCNIAWGSVYDSGDFLHSSETIKHRQSIVEIDNREGGTRPTYQSPYRFSDASSGVRTGSALLGENNAAILNRWLALDQTEVDNLLQQGVLAEDQGNAT
jgi:CoA:oxalate CoA-transferase